MKINFSLDSIVANNLFDRVRRFALHPRKAVTGALFTFDRKIRETFGKQTDPWGKPWPDLKEATWERRKSKGITSLAKLVAEKELFRSLDRFVDDANKGRIVIGTDDRPVMPHVLGAPEINLPARPMMPIKPPGVLDMPGDWQDDIEKVLLDSLSEVVER